MSKGSSLGSALVLALTVAAGAAAQQAAPAAFTLRGRVVDYESGARLAGALVEVRETRARALTDSTGHFSIADLAPGEYTFVTSQFGYITNQEASTVASGDFLTVSLLPKPVVLAGVQVTVDRMASRRKALAYSAWAHSREELLRYSGSVADFISARTPMGLMPCPASVAAGRGCAYLRGRVVPIRLWIDEVPSPSPDQLDLLRPEELYMVETYPALGMVRVYTVWFMERLAQTGRSLAPLCLVC